MKYKTILFDLDGTLTDPKIGITKSVQYALAKLDIEEPNLDKLTPFIGPPLKDSFIKYYQFDEKKAWQAVQHYREYFSEKGMFENNLYEGIHELIHDLFNQGKTLYVATSKPIVFSKQIINFFNLDEYFEGVIGPELHDRAESKIDVINKILDKNPQKDKKSFVMIGDREQDIIAAQKTGIDSIGVLFGYGSREELTNAKPTFMITSVEELKKLLLKDVSK